MERAIEEGIDFVGGKKDGQSYSGAIMTSPSALWGKADTSVDITVIVGVVGQRSD